MRPIGLSIVPHQLHKFYFMKIQNLIKSYKYNFVHQIAKF